MARICIMLQKIVSQLAILGENISQEDLNLKFLRSLPSEWNTHVVVWRNKPDLDTIRFDDLYNNFKIVEQEVKGTASSSSNSQNMAFVSSPNSTNEVNTAYRVRTTKTQVSPASTHDSTASTQISTANLCDDTIYAFLSYMADDEVPTNMARIAFSDSEGVRYLIKVEKGVGFTSYNVVPPPLTGLFSPLKYDLSNSGLEEFQQPEFEGYGPKPSKSVCEDTSNEVRESLDAPLIEELVSDEKKNVSLTVVKIEFVRPKQQEKSVRKPVKYAEIYRSQSPRGNQRNYNNQKSQKLGSDFVMYNKDCFVYGSFNQVQADCNYHQRERVVFENNYTRVDYNYFAKKAHPNAHRNMVPKAVLMKTGLRPLNNARLLIHAHHPKTTVYSARPMSRTLKTGKLDFEDVYFVKELQFNLFSVSQMYDKKNYVLFTDTGCFVLSPDFKLAYESQVLLKVPRKKNMYSVDIKNIVPKESLTCLVANATLDESMLWYRRLGHESNTKPLVFFLATKDETSVILKSFITEIENLVDKKVKIIRCDNGTEFKNRVMSEFCEKKGIKKEFSVARTP
ncbi:ribonuclease H-like domain-containing protein [Tanacetum coccineum]